MIDPSKYIVSVDDTVEDVDLNTEVVRLKDGRRLTDELAEELAQKTLAEVRSRNLIPGRKSLSGSGIHSPRVQFRLPDSLRSAAERRAAEEGVSLSVLAREALEHYLASQVGSVNDCTLCPPIPPHGGTIRLRVHSSSR